MKDLIYTKDTNGIVSVYDDHLSAETAVIELQQAGFDMRKLSIVGRDYQTEERIVGFYNIADRTLYWGKQGAFWGSLWGLLFGSAFFIIPGFGPLVIAGSFVSAIVGAIEGAALVGGIGALGAALFSIGIPKDSIVEYETALKADKYVMIAHGTNNDLSKAREIVRYTGGSTISDFELNNII
jgi:uncharacterized membrane protein